MNIPARTFPSAQSMIPYRAILRGPMVSCARPPITAPIPRKKIAIENVHIIVITDQWNAAISGRANRLQE